MTLVYAIAGVGFLAYLILVWILGGALHLKSPDIWVFRGGLALIGAGAAAAWIWWRRSRAQAGGPAEPIDSSNEIDILARDAEARLAAARVPIGSRMANFPLFFLLGESGAAKTSILVNSGLEAELLSGQVQQDGNVIPTRAANFWFTRQMVFAEAGGGLLGNRALWSRFIRRCRGGGSQAPRAAVVCVDAESLVRGGDAVAATARNLHERLNEISATLGIQFPVYVLFTRTDRIPYFREFVRNLSNDEAGQVVGATLPLGSVEPTGVYGEQQAARVGAAFDNLYCSLCGARPDLLARENDTAQRPATYEFAREFRKARNSLVPFLVDLCRPSQLTTAPFLRGFYFSGVRPVVVEDVPAPAPVSPAPTYGAPAGATSIFQTGQPARAAAVPLAAGTKRVAQWLFLSHLFNDVILRDRAALSLSAASARADSKRRLLLAAACALCLIAAGGFLVSWTRNRGLESRTLAAARAIPAGESTGMDLPSQEALERLDALRATTAELGSYRREGAPLSLRWGLYTGDDLYPDARRLYFERFRQLLFGQTQSSMLAFLDRLPAAPGAGDQYGPPYDSLKAYLITTSHHDKSTPAFLAPVLMRHWTAGRTVDPKRSQLAQAQFEFYAAELKDSNPYSSANDALVIERARRYLSQFGGMERVYQNMLAEASRNNPSIQFNRRFPGSAETVVDPREVSGAFTKGGWNFMKDAIQHANRYFSGEQWVLGDQAAANLDAAKLEQQLRDRYTSDFIGQWRDYLKSAAVVRYASIPDASKKLNQLSGNQSPLLALFWLASQNTAVDDPAIVAAFQPVQTVVPASAGDRYVAPPNQGYMSGLGALQTSLEQIAAQPGQPSDAAVGQVLGNAASAKSASRAVAQAFRPDPDGKVDTTVQKLMDDPITGVEALLRTLGPAELNGKGKTLCAQMRPVLAKYPFSPSASQQASLEEANSILRKPDGAIWAFYDANLQRLLTRQGAQYVPASAGGITLSAAFVAFFNRAAAVSDAFYGGGSQEPHLTYTLKPVPSEGIQGLTLRLDGQVLTTSAGSATPKQFVWPGTGVREAKASVKFGGTDLGWSSNDGLWAVFQFFEEAEKWQPAEGGYQLEWVVRAGKNAMTLPSGKPLTVRFELNMGGAPPVFEKGYLSHLGCVAEVAR
ncbi:MAG TPA: ImcF-related family protein [Candidatus Sulfopaludibacter sp.]|nr:ImcF-related family protein [Candidatus Sulfopaludibacter sp.]